MFTRFTYHPDYPLAQYIDTVWVSDIPNLKLSASHHAPLFTELIFNYGDQFQVTGQHTEDFVSRYDHQIISGLKTRPFQTNVSGSYKSIGLILKPHCYGLLSKRFASKAMAQLSEHLHEHLIVPEYPDTDRIDTALSTFFKGETPEDDILKFENYITRKLPGKGMLRNFNETISISQKSFIQKFKKHFFITPNEYIRLKQVNYAIRLIRKHPEAKLTAIGLEAGFYDQAHFIRVFKQYCGCPPGRFAMSKNAVG